MRDQRESSVVNSGEFQPEKGYERMIRIQRKGLGTS